MDGSALPLLQRLRLRFSRGNVLVVAVVVGLGAAVAWIGTGQPRAAVLELVALDASGAFVESLSVPMLGIDQDARFPLVLGVRNRGEAPAVPDSLFLSLPLRFRLQDRAGKALPSRYGTGSPLARYAIRLDPRVVPPGGGAGLLPGVDTLWIVPWLPDYYCVPGPSGVPEFVPAPKYEPSLLADVVVFYGFHTDREPRQTGLLRLHLDPAALRSQPGPEPPLFPTQRIGPDAPLPELPALFEVGERTEACGDPDQALTIHSVLWQTPGGGRVITLQQDSVARERLYDLNRDSIVELVVWDADGDGVFDARRQAQFPIPHWLLPRIVVAVTDSLSPDSGMVADSMPTGFGRARTDTIQGVIRRDTIQRNAIRRDTIRTDTIGPDPALR